MTLEAPVLNSPPAEKPKDENKSFGAENLTPEDIEKRERNVELLKQAVNRWIEENIRERNYLNKKELSQLVKFLHENHSEQIYAITDQFIDRGKYRNRPAVLFYEAGKDKYDVDIYLLGGAALTKTRIIEKSTMNPKKFHPTWPSLMAPLSMIMRRRRRQSRFLITIR
ncbi:MAG TPA: hypothetical protein VJJ72_00785 [Candidatus Paceibacterota bacterium]